METKFIEGTNEQYSIREDGAVISHYLRTRGVNSYRDKILPVHIHNTGNIYINGKKKTVSFPYLLYKYFGYKFCVKCNNKIYNILNYVCDDCNKKREKKYSDIITKNITKRYVARQLKISVSLLTDELYQNYKATLLVKRKIAEKLNTKPQYI